ncbi:MAG: coproporphyrinogen III oxidase, partial [Oscillospiraceae bacterium]|nr:coproporphyrinogen III oxidase [Oscillospiraceae bacterium]
MRSNSGKPLGIYVHIPFCKSKCEYCDFYSLGGSRDRRTTDQYLQALADHIRETGRLAPDYTVDTVYFGGGTPSFFGAENLEKFSTSYRRASTSARTPRLRSRPTPTATR